MSGDLVLYMHFTLNLSRFFLFETALRCKGLLHAPPFTEITLSTASDNALVAPQQKTFFQNDLPYLSRPCSRTFFPSLAHSIQPRLPLLPLWDPPSASSDFAHYNQLWIRSTLHPSLPPSLSSPILAHFFRPLLSLVAIPKPLHLPSAHLKFFGDTSTFIHYSSWSARGCILLKQPYKPHHKLHFNIYLFFLTLAATSDGRATPNGRATSV